MTSVLMIIGGVLGGIIGALAGASKASKIPKHIEEIKAAREKEAEEQS